MPLETRTCTPEDLLKLPDAQCYELVSGELVERNLGTVSSWIGGRLLASVTSFLDEHPLGWVLPDDCSYQCYPDDPDKVRRADLSFVRHGRLPGERLPEGHMRIPPDLAVEVISPNDLALEVDAKVAEYQTAGVRLIWVINPRTRTIRIHRADGSLGWLTEKDELTGEDVLPGFQCPVRKLFPPPVVTTGTA